MASLRIQGAGKLLRSATTARISLPLSARRFQSAVTTTNTVPSVNQPDYDAPADKATSTFSPVPKAVQDGSEDILPAAVISGAPMELQARTVRIYKEAKPATQSGDFRGERWRMDWDILPKGHRWENPLMGWQSSADFMQGTHINFKSKEDAIHFAEKQGYEYFVQEPNSRKFTPKAYANNFLYSPKKLKHIRTK
ncbi:ndufs4 NADH dehydrogenase Fe-S protein subunit [Purpureocillium takamizusanense]|uniref:NADH dehydrogenase [ubiquinone] iron-sulfur protein 4, mitochondrial n=1 Tax=Purpureocillium takamizusanense TaxID=2060973 RepID=A0A9Q8QIP0_9HYPO|nr:ndufs4 NADH dehydrogenase Fe-S protein subunit [Purpureocillium takamizusanense]UNI20410.1 ndufs4 NADH dehydrogenase Fe-S protein subunit [Purpureocillium takamizusanense]